jgi:hypothetical protein
LFQVCYRLFELWFHGEYQAHPSISGQLLQTIQSSFLRLCFCSWRENISKLIDQLLTNVDISITPLHDISTVMPGNMRTNRSQSYAIVQIVSFANLSNEVPDIVRIYVNEGLLLLILERCVRQLRSMSYPAYWVFDLWAIVTFMMELNIGINYNDYL